MKPARKLRLTAAMQTALENAILYDNPAHGLTGRSAHGGFTRTLSSLRYHGLLDWQNQPTKAGRKLAGYRKARLTVVTPAQKRSVRRKACSKCRSTGWCHAMQKCDVTKRALRIIKKTGGKATA